MPETDLVLLVVSTNDSWIRPAFGRGNAEPFRVMTVDSIGVALAYVRRNEVDVLVLDTSPGELASDLVVSDQIRSIDPGIQTLVIIERLSDEIRELGPLCRVAAWVSSPFDPASLLQTAQELLARRARQFGRCIGCRFHLPLLRPSEGKGQNFRCTVCSQHYHAEFDEHVPANHHDFVERID
ncbi:MAG: hypothetical protein RL885_32185 [Planctomycetota bacterium]